VIGVEVVLFPILLRFAETPTIGDIRLEPRAPLVLYLVPSKDRPSKTPGESFLQAADAILESRTNLTARSLEQAGVDRTILERCTAEYRLSCWMQSMRAAIPSLTASSTRTVPLYVLVVSVQPEGEDTDALVSMLIDVERALAVYDAAESSPKDESASERWKEEAEQRIYATIPRSALSVVKTSDDRALRSFFSNLFEGTYRAELERTGCWKPFGAITLTGTHAGWPVTIDGSIVGVTNEGTTAIRSVRPGRHVVSVALGGDAPFRAIAEVERERDAALAVAVDEARSPIRGVVAWSGLGVAAIGLFLDGIAWAKANDGVQAACLIRPGAEGAHCSELGTPSFAYDPSKSPSLRPSDVNPKGVSIAPLGTALMITGAVTALGTWLFDDDGAFPWPQLLIGVVSGAATYAVGAALDAR
jgi:hypothetical protein